MDTKGLLQAGYKKKTCYLLIEKDSYYTNKKHYIVMEDLEAAKEFKTVESIQQVTMFYKEND
ncbi:MAG: hypothetical protein J6R47_01900 [Acholeplasmatales bacterium]|nr:hypothetical protein [Acholeplasmatales bacterium]